MKVNCCCEIIVCLLYYSFACAIPDTDTVVLTGGANTLNTVALYNDKGWVEDFPDLSIGRQGHACAGYTSDGRRVR